jgi:serine/threonine-protein kinase
MARLFPKPKDSYQVVYRGDTDLDLPEHVVNNTMRYTEFKTIAKGGKCLIQSCKDYHLSRIVAYKSLLKEIADDPFEQRRFIREARVTAMLQHPNTIPIYELSRDNRRHYYFTMKLVEGFTLRELLDTGKEDAAPSDGYGFHRYVTILIQVGNALDYAHTHGVVHRDIKPANILMGPFGEVLVLDWGLAKVWGADEEEIPENKPLLSDFDPTLTAQGRLQGSALYMSPEQIAEARDLDHRSDIYSMGVVLYEILSGEHMIAGKDLDTLLDKTKNEMPPPPSEIAPDRPIPEELENICMRCIQKDPSKRIQTARQLVSALRAWRIRWSAGGRL